MLILSRLVGHEMWAEGKVIHMLPKLMGGEGKPLKRKKKHQKYTAPQKKKFFLKMTYKYIIYFIYVTFNFFYLNNNHPSPTPISTPTDSVNLVGLL